MGRRRSGDASSGGGDGDGKLTVGGTVDGHIKIAVMTRSYYIVILPASYIGIWYIPMYHVLYAWL